MRLGYGLTLLHRHDEGCRRHNKRKIHPLDFHLYSGLKQKEDDMNHIWKFADKEIYCDVFDPDCYERIDGALKSLSSELSHIEYSKDGERGEIADRLRRNCEVIEGFSTGYSARTQERRFRRRAQHHDLLRRFGIVPLLH